MTLLVAVFVSCNSNGNKEKLRRWALELNAHSPEDLLGVKYTDENELLFLYVLNIEDQGIFNDFVNRQAQMKRKQMLLLSTNSKNITDYFQALIAQEGKIVYEFMSADGSQLTKIVVTTGELKQILDELSTMTTHQRLNACLDYDTTGMGHKLPVEVDDGIKLTGYVLDDAWKTLFLDYAVDEKVENPLVLSSGNLLEHSVLSLFTSSTIDAVHRNGYELKYRLHVPGIDKPYVVNERMLVYVKAENDSAQ